MQTRHWQRAESKTTPTLRASGALSLLACRTGCPQAPTTTDRVHACPARQINTKLTAHSAEHTTQRDGSRDAEPSVKAERVPPVAAPRATEWRAVRYTDRGRAVGRKLSRAVSRPTAAECSPDESRRHKGSPQLLSSCTEPWHADGESAAIGGMPLRGYYRHQLRYLCKK